jgi:hypothetical protein
VFATSWDDARTACDSMSLRLKSALRLSEVFLDRRAAARLRRSAPSKCIPYPPHMLRIFRTAGESRFHVGNPYAIKLQSPSVQPILDERRALGDAAFNGDFETVMRLIKVGS